MKSQPPTAAPPPAKLLYVSPFSAAISGPDESLLLLLSHLPRQRYAATVALPPQSPHRERYRNAGAEVLALPLDRLRRSYNPAVHLLNLGRALRAAWILRRYIRRAGIDLVHTNMEVTLGGGLAARLAGVPSVFHYRGNADPRRGLFFHLYFWLLRALADRVVAISAAVQKVFAGHPLERISRVIYNGYDPQALGRGPAADLRARFALPPQSKLIGTVGRIHPRKRIDLLLSIAAAVRREMPEAVFFLIGDATSPQEEIYKRQLLARARALQLENHFFISGVRRDVAAWLRGLDLFLFCAEREGFGRAVLEAQAAGLAVVAAAEGGIAEIVDPGRSGILIAKPEPGLYAEALLGLLRRPEEAREMGRTGRERMERLFSPAPIVGQMTALYEELLASRARDKR